MNVPSRQIRIILPLVAAALIAGCGGGGGGSPPAAGTPPPANLTGVFSDAPVAGLSYRTSTGNTGTTDAQGQFSYAAGDTVTFSVGNVTLGTTQQTLTASTTGATTVTPVNLVAGATNATNTGVTAIGQLLDTLNNIAVATGTGKGGIFTIPANAATLVASLGTTNLGTTTASLTSAQLQPVVSAAGNVASSVSPTTAANAQANLNQGINASSVIGTVWSGTCSPACGGGSFYFKPDGTLAGVTADGSLLSGTWSGSATAAGGVQILLLSSDGGYVSGTIPANGTSLTTDIYDSSGNKSGKTITLSEVTASTALSNTLYVGGWYVGLTPNAAGTAAQIGAGSAFIILFPDGTFKGITDGSATVSGTWSPTTGVGTGTTSDSLTVAINAATQTGTLAQGATVYGNLTMSRNGNLTLRGSSSSNPIPLVLNVRISWPANVGNAVSSFSLALSVYDATGKQVASGIKAEHNPLGAGAVADTTTDNIVASYPQGGATQYSLSVGPVNCGISGNSGSVNDANSNNPGAYPTVTITCH